MSEALLRQTEIEYIKSVEQLPELEVDVGIIAEARKIGVSTEGLRSDSIQTRISKLSKSVFTPLQPQPFSTVQLTESFESTVPFIAGTQTQVAEAIQPFVQGLSLTTKMAEPTEETGLASAGIVTDKNLSLGIIILIVIVIFVILIK